MRVAAVVLVAAVAMALLACTSPEARRTRAGGRGGDTGNRGGVVLMHEGSRPFYRTPQVIAKDSAPDLEPGRQADRLSHK